jgi:predicted nucleotidyltransferase
MATRKILNKRSKEIAKRYLAKLRDADVEVTQALVFGSQATGEADENSDIDLAVVSPQFGRDKHKDLVRLFKLVDEKTKELEPIPFSPTDLEDEFDSLATEVRATGVSIDP